MLSSTTDNAAGEGRRSAGSLVAMTSQEPTEEEVKAATTRPDLATEAGRLAFIKVLNTRLPKKRLIAQGLLRDEAARTHRADLARWSHLSSARREKLGTLLGVTRAPLGPAALNITEDLLEAVQEGE